MKIDNVTTQGLPLFEIVENGVDSTDYVVEVVAGEFYAQARASGLNERHAYLGYGYTVRPAS